MSEDKTKLDIEQLKKKYTELNAKRIAAETNLQNAEEQLGNLKQQARDRWGTDDLEQLRQKLAEMKADNEHKRAAYQLHIEQIETRLQTIETETSETQSGNK